MQVRYKYIVSFVRYLQNSKSQTKTKAWNEITVNNKSEVKIIKFLTSYLGFWESVRVSAHGPKSQSQSQIRTNFYNTDKK